MRPPSLPDSAVRLRMLLSVILATFVLASLCAEKLVGQSGFPLQGTVTNSVTGEAIRRASVQALGPKPRAALTDDEGHFRLEGLPDGEVPIIVTKPGYLPEQAANPAERAPTVARTGPDAPALALKLMPQGVIFGRITSADGDPLEGMPVMVIRQLIVSGRKVLSEQSSVSTNDDGEFRAGNLAAGTYYVMVGPGPRLFPGVKGVANPREAAYPATYYPGAPSVDAAGLVSVPAGQETEANLELKAEPVFHVNGVATGFPPGTVGEMIFARVARDGADVSIPIDSDSGKFDVKLRAGIYRVRGVGGRGNWGAVGDAPLTLNADAKDLHIAMARLPAISASSRLESAQAAPVGRDAVKVWLHDPSIGIALMSHHNMTGQADYEGRILPSKPLALADLEPETYRVTITPTDGQWVQTAECGGVDLLNSDLTIAPGAHPAPLQIVVRDDVANLSGTVSAADGIKGAIVLLLPPADSRLEVKTTAVSPQGTFEFTGVPPGTYIVLALDHTEGLEYTKREALEGYLSKAVETVLSPGGSGTVQLELARVER